MDKKEEMINRFIEWGNEQPGVRAMIMTSTLAIPGSESDILSDYDVILILDDVRPFFESRGWLKAFGNVLALYRDPLESEQGSLKSGYVIQFEQGLKIDFSLWEIDIFQKIEVFFLDTTYVAKFLWRDDLVAAKHIQELLIQEHLLPMLVWHIEIEHGWSVKPGPYGRNLKKWLRPDLWEAMKGIYTGAGLNENWEGLFLTIELMHKTAVEVGEKLGFFYPYELETKMIAHLQRVKELDKEANRF
jgi:aminoglycoside 6-adenylyltransferase